VNPRLVTRASLRTWTSFSRDLPTFLARVAVQAAEAGGRNESPTHPRVRRSRSGRRPHRKSYQVVVLQEAKLSATTPESGGDGSTRAIRRGTRCVRTRTFIVDCYRRPLRMREPNPRYRSRETTGIPTSTGNNIASMLSTCRLAISSNLMFWLRSYAGSPTKAWPNSKRRCRTVRSTPDHLQHGRLHALG
jgi:hypothetical protein